MLALIGMGLGTNDISVSALDFISNASKVYVEHYTAAVDQRAVDSIAGMAGKKIDELQRSDMEDRVKETVSQAKNEDVAILVYGDPLVATTHHILIDEARKQGIRIKIFHSSSVFSAAIGESGLDIYRFGPPITIPYWSEKYKPTSFIDPIKKNIDNNLHTMLLLDINQKENRPMSISEAVEIIETAQQDKTTKIIDATTKMLIIGNIGRDNQSIIYTAFKDAKSHSEILANKMLVVILPSNPNFAEAESISKFQKQ